MNTKQRLIVLLALVSVILGCENNRNHVRFIKNHPDNLESAHKLAVLATTFGKEKTTELFDRLDPSIKNSINGKLIEQYLLLNKDLKIGDHFVDFEMSDSNNQPRKLSEFQGKVVLLEFWASTCGGCLNETSFLKKAYEEYHNDGFEILAVSFDENKEHWLKTVKQMQLNWIHVSELRSTGNTAGFIYGVYSIPDNFLIDTNGIIIDRDLKGDELEKKLNEILNK